MSDQELTELLTHPRLRAYIQRIAEEAAACVYARLPESDKHSVRPYVVKAGPGELNYRDAAAYIGTTIQVIRTYVYRKKLTRGKTKGTVTFESCAYAKKAFKPRPELRTEVHLHSQP